MPLGLNLSSEHVAPDGAVRIDYPVRNLDSFERLRTASPNSQFNYQNEYNKGPLIWGEKATGTGVATHIPASSTVLLSTGGTASGAGIIRQTKKYFRYTPGESLLAIDTAQFGKPQANVTKRFGLYDGSDGIYLEQSGGTYWVVLRSSSTGTVIENRVPRSKWSGGWHENYNFEKSTIFLADVQWLGVGRVRTALEIDGNAHELHTFDHAGLIDQTYMRTANLPVRDI